jgi:hypothetical protein
MATQAQREAKKLGVNLSDDHEFGYTKYPNIKRTDKICPRCQGRVSKEKRMCLDCKGRLIWDGDDASEFNRRMEYWFCWHKPTFGGVRGWYSRDYFMIKPKY